jgi:hypothetical protein
MRAAAEYILLGAWLTITSAQGGVLPVDQIYQEKDQWCWAGSCQAALRFYGIRETQTNIAIYGASGSNLWNYLWGQGTPSGETVFRRGCDLIINNFGGVKSSGFTGVLTAPALQAEINAERPVFINWLWDGGGGHILLARGMVNSNVYLMDPWYGPSVNDYAWVCQGNGHTWQWTLQLSTASRATNNVPRWWLGNYGLTDNWDWDALALGDKDRDGVPTWQEYLADTVPTNGASFLALAGVAVSNDDVMVSWQGGVQSTQLLERRPDMTSTTWAVIWTNLPPTAASPSKTDSNAMPSAFYRIRALR